LCIEQSLSKRSFDILIKIIFGGHHSEKNLEGRGTVVLVIPLLKKGGSDVCGN
jgi:hypothetical protein